MSLLGNACFVVYCVEKCWSCVWSHTLSHTLSVLYAWLAICCEKQYSVFSWTQFRFSQTGIKKCSSPRVKTEECKDHRLYRATPPCRDISIAVYQSLLPFFSANVSTAKRTYYHNKINNSSNSRMLFKTFSSLLCPPPPPHSSTLTADDFATLFINKVKTISAQLSTPQSVKHILPANIHPFTTFSSLSEAEVSKLILSNQPTTCPLDPIPSHLLQAIYPAVASAITHIINISLRTGVFRLSIKTGSYYYKSCTYYLRNPPLTHLL